ncbi:hypothetical protein F5Y16DRAFT_236259 [Xylariaceae sp. FL0255]|nr:hypothetical protein F5Y16DRAFT_236259 [Xylariaceae sp. FL0255]
MRCSLLTIALITSTAVLADHGNNSKKDGKASCKIFGDLVIAAFGRHCSCQGHAHGSSGNPRNSSSSTNHPSPADPPNGGPPNGFPPSMGSGPPMGPFMPTSTTTPSEIGATSLVTTLSLSPTSYQDNQGNGGKGDQQGGNNGGPDHSPNDGPNHSSTSDQRDVSIRRKAIIVGAVIGSVLGILLITFIGLWIRSQAKQRNLLKENVALKELDLESHRTLVGSRHGSRKSSLRHNFSGSELSNSSLARIPEGLAMLGAPVANSEDNMNYGNARAISPPQRSPVRTETHPFVQNIRPVSPTVVSAPFVHEYPASDPAFSQISLHIYPSSPQTMGQDRVAPVSSIPYFPRPPPPAHSDPRQLYCSHRHSMSQPNFHRPLNDSGLEMPPPPRYPDAVANSYLASTGMRSSPVHLPSPTSSAGPQSPVRAVSPLSEIESLSRSNSSSNAYSPVNPAQHSTDSKSSGNNYMDHIRLSNASYGLEILAPIIQLGQTPASPPEYDQSAEAAAATGFAPTGINNGNSVTAAVEDRDAAIKGAIYRY